MPKHESMLDRFMKMFTPEPNSGCWLWLGSTTHDGYPVLKVSLQRFNVYAHRLSYELFCGEIPEGLEVDHLCRVRCCVNPDHLEAVTPGINQLRAGFFRMKTHCKHGHEFTPENTYTSKAGHKTMRVCRTCANQRARDYHRKKAAA